MYVSQRAHSTTAILRNDIVALLNLAGGTSNQTTICVVITVYFCHPSPNVFSTKEKRADPTKDGSFSIFAYLANSERNTNSIHYKPHSFFSQHLGFSSLIFKNTL